MSQVFPADDAVATVSKDNMFSGRASASVAYVPKNLGWGGCSTSLVSLTGASLRIILHKIRRKVTQVSF